MEKKTNLTWIYLMRDYRTGFIKIGKSDKPAYREKTLQAQVPLIEILEAWFVHPREETILHREFKPWRLRGEWFDLTYFHIQGIHNYFDGAPRLLVPDTHFNEALFDARRDTTWLHNSESIAMSAAKRSGLSF